MTDGTYKPLGSLTKEQANALYDTKFWEGMTAREIAESQLSEDLLCMPFDILHGAVEKALGRSVWTHEFGTVGIAGLRAELFEGKPAPTMDDILNLIPAEKRIVIEVAS